MGQFLVRDLDIVLVDRLKARAARHGRSLQSEVKRILEQAAGSTMAEALAVAASIRGGRKRKHSDSAAMIRKDRGR